MKLLLPLLLSLWVLIAGAQQELEIIELRSTTVEQVLPALRPLLEPGATLSGMSNQLFLRASPRNRAEIRRALAALDRPQRQLLITLSRQPQGSETRRGGALSLDSQRGGGQAEVWDTRSVRTDRTAQSVRAQDGSPAFIQVGQSLALPMRQVILTPNGAVLSDTVVYRDVGQGFYALPRVSGERVTIDISQQADILGDGARQGRSERIATSVSGRLGEWLQLGGTDLAQGAQRSQPGVISSRELRTQDAVWLKVEEIQ